VAAILIAEDEERITSFLEKGLQAHGFSTEVATDGDKALRLARSWRFDLLILDLGLPGKSGIEVLRQLRAEGNDMPIVILTARHGLEDMVAGLNGGANDYLTKPFRFDELLARVRARLREYRAIERHILHAGDLALDLRTQQAIVRGESVRLSPREFELARAFFLRPGEVLTRRELLQSVWGQDFDPGSNILDVYVGYVRRKLGRERIKSVRGVGYRLEVRAHSETAPGGG
jgi:DNA-binding response OmpR family regulator